MNWGASLAASGAGPLMRNPLDGGQQMTRFRPPFDVLKSLAPDESSVSSREVASPGARVAVSGLELRSARLREAVSGLEVTSPGGAVAISRLETASLGRGVAFQVLKSFSQQG